MIKSEYKVIAVMSGTSLDGIDIIEVIFSYKDSLDFKINNCKTLDYSTKWKVTLATLVDLPREGLIVLDQEYSSYLGEKINQFIKSHNITNIDFIASHGHTALHQPENNLTYQIGNLQVLADIVKEKVICDFRVQDVKLGGQGAPLVPIGDRLLFNQYEYCLNLGGFANISFEKKHERIAFDICPVNIVLNKYVSNLGLPYDNKGEIALSGELNVDLLNQLNALQFYNKIPPKSLGLEWVETYVFPIIDAYSFSTETILRTFVEHVAIQIANVLTFDTGKVLITGGGVYNSFLIERLKYHTKLKIIVPNDKLIEYKEALIFGLLGVLKERNEVNCLKSVTGANNNHSSGKILFPNP